MDRDLSELERAWRAAPADVGLAQRLEAALLRAGRRGDVLERYAAKHACAQTGSTLDGSGADPWVRRCSQCSRGVAVLREPADVVEQFQAGACVVTGPGERAQALDALVDGPLDFAQAPRPCCLVIDHRVYGLVISGLALPDKRQRALEIIQRLRGISRQEAEGICCSPVVPVLHGVSPGRAEAAREEFVAARINCRLTVRAPR
jgi:hypothetical protein